MEYDKLQTEGRNEKSSSLDEMSTLEAAKLMNQMDKEVALSVENALPEIGHTIDMAYDTFTNGGRLIYVGAGTSGRLGVLDASECLPTFGISSDMVVGIIAGGDKALRFAVEGAEDDAELAVKDMENLGVNNKDLVIAISASGSATYCSSALQYAKEHGAKTAGICCVEDPSFASLCDVLIKAVVGAEILTGSTRLRAGTATKMVLNMISTLSMVKLGKVYENLMVDVVPTNKKLIDRSVRIIMAACKVSRNEAQKMLEDAGEETKTAIVRYKTGASVNDARKALQQSNGFIKKAIHLIDMTKDRREC